MIDGQTCVHKLHALSGDRCQHHGTERRAPTSGNDHTNILCSATHQTTQHPTCLGGLGWVMLN